MMATFDHEGARFNVRTVGVVIHGDRVLLHRTERDSFWALPGGRVELLEPAADALKRELKEELRVEVHVERLVWMVENFFEHDGKSYHELAFYFLVSLPSGCDLYARAEPFEGEDGGIRLIFQWFPVDALEDVELYPTFLRSSLTALPASTEHVVHVDRPQGQVRQGEPA